MTQETRVPPQPAYEPPRVVTLGSVAQLTQTPCPPGHNPHGFPFTSHRPLFNCSA